MTASLILEAFVDPSASGPVISEREGRKRQTPSSAATEMSLLHIAFDARANLMAWAASSSSHRNLWNLYEAGLTGDRHDAALVGWVYVGLPNPVGPSSEISEEEIGAEGWGKVPIPNSYGEAAVALPVVLVPLVQCLDDALKRMGVVDVSGFQITCYNAQLTPPNRVISRMTNGTGWFGAMAGDKAKAFITFDQGFLAGHSASELLNGIQRRFSGDFSFDQVVAAPEQYWIVNTRGPAATFQPSGDGIAITLPEWTACAAGWALATVVDATRVIAPDTERFMIRVARA